MRGNDISMIFQEPMTSLNPVLTIGDQISEPLVQHQGVSRRNALREAVQMLRLVHIPEPERRVREYPHQLSGGMRQRVMIAMHELQEKLDTAVLLITHDMGVIAEHAERVVVMYAGRKVEEAPVLELFARPTHPYTRGLLASIPRLGSSTKSERPRLSEIEGIVPSLFNLPEGCSFAPRCPHATEQCRQAVPLLESIGPGHSVACWHRDGATGSGL